MTSERLDLEGGSPKEGGPVHENNIENRNSEIINSEKDNILEFNHQDSLGKDHFLSQEKRSQHQSFNSFRPGDLIEESHTSTDQFKVLNESLPASKDTVFLSWHNIRFDVPLLKTDKLSYETSKCIDVDDPRVEIIKSHNNEIQTENTTLGASSQNASIFG
jgi:hypothetical protein